MVTNILRGGDQESLAMTESEEQSGGTLGSLRDVKSFHPQNLYFQANLVHGYRFYDESGKIMNKLADDYVDVRNGMDGLQMRDPKEDGDLPMAVNVTPDRIWFQYAEPKSWEEHLPSIHPLLRDISQILGVDRYSRLGLRIEYFAPTDTNSDRVTELAKRAAGIPFQQDIDAITDGLEFSVQIKGRLRHLSTSLSARSVVLQRPPRRRGDFPQNGLIVDIDSYETSEKTLNDVRIFIGQAKSNIDDVMGTTVTLWLGESS